MDIIRITNERSTVYQLNNSEASEFISYPNELSDDPKLSSSTAALIVSLDNFAATVNANSQQFRPEFEPAENLKAAQRLYPSIKSQVVGYRTAAREFAEAETRSLDLAPQTDALREHALTARLERLPMPQRVALLANANFADTSAALRYGDAYRLLPAESAEALRHRHRVLGHMERTGLRADHARRSTLADPFASGVDEAAAFAAAEGLANAHYKRRERLSMAADALRATVRLLAAATGQSPEAVWENVRP